MSRGRARSKPKRTRARILGRWAWRLSLAYLVGLVLLYVAEAVVAERYWATLAVTYVFQHPLLVPAGALLLVSLPLREWRAAALNVLALAFVLFGFMGLALPHRHQSAPGGVKVRVMTLNAAYFHEVDAPELARVIEDQRLDVVCLQEASVMHYGMAAKVLRGLPSEWRVVAEGQLTVLSRLPVQGWTVREYSQGSRAALAVALEAKGRPFTVVCTHFSTPYPPERAKHNWRALAGYLPHRAEVRQAQANELLAFVREQSDPVLVAGDFNTPARGLIYRQLASRLRDSFAAVGSGFGYSFPAVRPRYRIDYLWAGLGLVPVECRVLPLRVSDHCPVAGEFVVAKEGK